MYATRQNHRWVPTAPRGGIAAFVRRHGTILMMLTGVTVSAQAAESFIIQVLSWDTSE